MGSSSSCCCFQGAKKALHGRRGAALPREEAKLVADFPEPPTPSVQGSSWLCRLRCCTRRERPQLPPEQLQSFAVDEYNARCPTLDALDERQRGLLNAMRSRLDAMPPKQRPPRRHDLWLKRFLAHGKWNLEKALKLYLEMEAWRQEVGADKILTEFPDGKLNSVLPIDTIGFYPYSFDQSGRLIAWMTVGNAPWWRALFERTEEAVRAQVFHGEWLDRETERAARRTGVWRERAVILVDLSKLDFAYFKGASGSSRARRRGAGHTTAQYYPGVVDKAYIIHAPGFANKAWGMIKFFLSAKLMEKAVLVSNNSEMAAMLKTLGAENVPRALGGKSDKATFPWPESLSMPKDGWKSVLDAWAPKQISIRAGSVHEELLVVPAGKRARWQWTLQSGHILFEVCQRRSGEEFYPVGRKESFTFDDVEEPCYNETRPLVTGGEVRFIWDNTMSRFSSKTLFARLQIV